MHKLRVTIWNEFRHEKNDEPVRKLYPLGMHRAIADGIAADDLEIRLASLDEPEQGLPEALLDETDVLFWWGHRFHAEVSDELVARVVKRVQGGMGFIALHSSHMSKVFRALMGTSCTLICRVAAERERVWTIDSSHPLAQGIGPCFELEHEEMYGERFDIPDDGKLVFASWFEGGELFRSGVAFRRGYGSIFYFAPGHEEYPTFYDRNVLRILGNAARWAAPSVRREPCCVKVKPREPIGRAEVYA
ncbi:MAG: trehalose utilization protein ThuA [Lentisphaeria bacterium]|nr:trehalose utilization protein ThuA [Lentisphaeria bacterium]